MVKIRIEQTSFTNPESISFVETANGDYSSDIDIYQMLDLFKDLLKALGYASEKVDQIDIYEGDYDE